ncbi:protein kinase domain-containing protein [Flavobacterium koreense]
MDEIDFYSETSDFKKIILESKLGNRGKCISIMSGMCGEIFVFDQGQNTFPRYSCVKVPKPLGVVTYEEIANRFIRELELQLSFYHSTFVNWAFDFNTIENVPSASFRYWNGDLGRFILENELSNITKLSFTLYICAGLKHCYERGLIAHQDLKPANILVKDNYKNFTNLPKLDIYHFAVIADFGLANASIDYNVFDGSRPYMAPEQWKREPLSNAADVFALGVIFYELITNGYHPIGILLNDHWPEPKHGNSKKYTRRESWENWINNGAIINPCPIIIEPNVISFIAKMLSVNSSDRPSIEEIMDFLLELIKSESEQSFIQIKFLLTHFEEQSTKTPIEDSWPYVSAKFNELKHNFKNS